MPIDSRKLKAFVEQPLRTEVLEPAGKIIEVPGFKAGGKGPFTFPQDHIAAMEVPQGGSSCANCKFVDAEAHSCNSPHYQTWNGGDRALPDLPLDSICSDWYEP